MPNANPRYPLYAYLALSKSFPYAERYKIVVPAAEYFTEVPYEPAGLSKPFSSAASYPLVHVVLLEQFDPHKKTYNRANLFAPRLKVPAGAFYVSYAQDFHTNANPLSIEQPKPVEIAATFTKLLESFILLDWQTHLAQPESGTDKLTGKFAKTPLQIQGTKPTPKISLEIQEASQIPQSPTTLEANVRKIYGLQSTPQHEIHNTNPHHQIQISLPHNQVQQAQAPEARIESRLMTFPTQTLVYEKLKTRMLYGSNQSPIQPKPTPENYKLIVQRNYDMQPQWLNVMGSKLWTSVIGKKYSGAQKSEKYDSKKNNAKIRSSVKDEKIGNKEKPDYKNGTQFEDKEISKDDTKYKTQEKPEAVPQTRKDYQPDGNKKYVKKKPSALTYAGAVAGIGLLGLASLVSLPFRKKSREVERQNLYVISNNITNEPQTSQAKTIDLVVTPTAHNGKITQSQNLFFNPISNKLIENLIREAEKKGAKVHFYAFNVADGSSYEYNAKESIPSASLNKIAISYVLVSMLQQGLLDINNEVPYVPQLILDKEAEKEQFKIFAPGVAKSYKLDDLISSTLGLSGNSSASLILYALGSNGTYKENPTNDEIREQITRGMQIVNNYMEAIGFSGIKIRSPYLSKGKLEALGIHDDHTKNETTPEENSKFLAFIKQGGNLIPQYYKMLTSLMAGEQTAKHYWDILGGVDLGKPGLDKFNNGLAFVKGDIVATLILEHTNPMHSDDLRHKSELHNLSTDYGKEILNYLAKYCTTLHNLMQPSIPKMYKQIFNVPPNS